MVLPVRRRRVPARALSLQCATGWTLGRGDAQDLNPVGRGDACDL